MSSRHTLQKEAYTLTVDRDLPVPVGVQLRGQIEYGVATGEIARGTRLPSVRELARGLNIAPATVSAAYKELQEAGLLESQQGRGTFVPAALAPAPEPAALLALRRAVDELFKTAERLDFTQREVAEAVSLWAGQKRVERGLCSLFVGIFPEATDAYVATLRDSLRWGDTVVGTTFATFAEAALPTPDLYVTFANRERALRELVGSAAPIVSVTFIPSEATRTHLAALSPETRLAVVVGVPEFLPTLREHVARYAPHLDQVRVVTLAATELTRTLGWSSALVYATGAEEVLALPHPSEVFEFRYEPEPRSVHQSLLPALEALRRRDDLTHPQNKARTEKETA